jgi:hypothetical protein
MRYLYSTPITVCEVLFVQKIFAWVTLATNQVDHDCNHSLVAQRDLSQSSCGNLLYSARPFAEQCDDFGELVAGWREAVVKHEEGQLDEPAG